MTEKARSSSGVITLMTAACRESPVYNGTGSFKPCMRSANSDPIPDLKMTGPFMNELLLFHVDPQSLLQHHHAGGTLPNFSNPNHRIYTLFHVCLSCMTPLEIVIKSN